MEPGSILILDVEKAIAGGRMLARHGRQVVLVWGAIPGERVRARVERTGKGVVYAETIDVVTASADRRDAVSDWRCGGSVLTHVAYPRQTQLKSEIIADAFGRIGRTILATPPDVVGSPEHGYRMRARLHVRDGRIGFFREGSHQVCDAASTRQLLPATAAWVAEAQTVLTRERLGGVTSIDVAENVSADARACHLELSPGGRCDAYAILASSTGVTGLSAQQGNSPVEHLGGSTVVVDEIRARVDAAAVYRVRRDVRAFFQGNRFLLERLVQHVVALVPEGPVVDLYAGVGLFGLGVAASGGDAVTLVEGDPVSAADLRENAAPFGARVAPQGRSVEAFLTSAPRNRGGSFRSGRREGGAGNAGGSRAAGRRPDAWTDTRTATFIVDPPRTGLSTDAVEGLIRLAPPRIVYVSCDVATLARDTRLLIDGGFALEGLTGFDLFPNTAHVECVAVFVRPAPTPVRDGRPS